ncbi:MULTISPECIES: septal ring lytic transglycosylase RlpA family protein [Rhodonellum]|nr:MULTISPECIES: septal ring lytic transglycosylase RlpA family protein [Rhodonellum]SDY53579.1 rare lipoprotein A [Rhodonellum ikkaensis]
MKLTLLLFFIVLSMSPSLASGNGGEKDAEAKLKIQEGIASFYGRKFHLRKTANGETFKMEEMTAAHKNLPFGTMLKVINTKNNKVVWVRVNDRLPQNSKRIIDLSRGAAKELEMIQDGIVKVNIEVPDQETVFSLMDHFQDEVPEGIRLRVYEEPIDFEKPDLCFSSLALNLNPKSTASI